MINFNSVCYSLNDIWPWKETEEKEEKIGPLGSWKDKNGRVSVMQGSAGLATRPANRAIGCPGEGCNNKLLLLGRRAILGDI